MTTTVVNPDDREAAAVAIRRYRSRATRLTAAAAGCAALIVALWRIAPAVIPSWDSSGVGARAAVYPLALVAVTLVGGLLSLRRARRMTVLLLGLADHRRVRVSVDPLGNRRPAVVLLADPPKPEAVLVVSAFRWRVGPLEDADGGVIRVWGEPEREAVLLPPDSQDLYLARRPRLRWWRDRLRHAVLG